ncbi:putative nuclease HARBI1 [Saccostrea cucullata]|uniref:putative nuclease HARBI1 n=1 Tax=Saccostrea cuccullata TaxID=36930 RepID=UPI002ED16F44
MKELETEDVLSFKNFLTVEPDFLRVEPDEWQQIAEQFRNRRNLDHVLGALDGKHIAIKCPRNGGSLYYNYKGFHLLILMGLVDADYKFIWVDVGANGSASDATVFNNSELKDVVENHNIGFPEDAPLPNDNRISSWVMTPSLSGHGL